MIDHLTERRVTRTLPAYRQILDLYFEAFPAEERFPVWQLNLMATKQEIEYVAYFDGSLLAGFSYSVIADDYVYLVFLAVNASVRSQGYGSRILSLLRERFQNQTIVLDIEPLDPASENFDQRTSRLRFYQRNGYSFTGFDLFEGDVRYTVLANSQAFDPAAFKRQMDDVLRGEFPVVLKPSNDLTGE